VHRLEVAVSRDVSKILLHRFDESPPAHRERFRPARLPTRRVIAQRLRDPFAVRSLNMRVSGVRSLQGPSSARRRAPCTGMRPGLGLPKGGAGRDASRCASIASIFRGCSLLPHPAAHTESQRPLAARSGRRDKRRVRNGGIGSILWARDMGPAARPLRRAIGSGFQTKTGGSMPTWVRHKTGSVHQGGFWTGSDTDTFADNCSDQDKANIDAAFKALNANGGLDCFPALRDCMRGKWDTIPVDCCFDESRPPRGGQLEALIFVCNMNSAQAQAEICQGLVRACGGHTLDVKAMLFSCFGAPSGVPSTADFNDMVNEPQFGGNANEREGQFVIWNRQTGEVWNKTTTTSSGFWTGSTSTAKGNRCFGNPAWVF
jgi:hypothetical protein